MSEKKQAQPSEAQIEAYERLELANRIAEAEAELRFKNKLMNLYTEASMYKQSIMASWDSYTKFVRGKQWPARRPGYKVSAVMNFIIENIERKTALLTDAKPIPHVIPRQDAMQDTADILNILLSMVYEDSSFGLANADLIENSQVFGSGFLSTVLGVDETGTRDSLLVYSVDPRAMYIDPLCMKSYLLGEAEYVILEDIWPLSKAQDLYPERADKFTADAGLSRFKRPQDQSFFAVIRNKVLGPNKADSDTVASEIPRVFVREYWLKDRSKDDKGKPRFKNQSRKVIMVGDVIADDGDNPYNDGQFPFDMLSWHTDFETMWGWGDVELLESPQTLVNKVYATILENIILMSNAIWIGDADAMAKEDWKNLTNAPGSYVKKRIGRELRREPGVPLPAYVLDTLQSLKMDSEQITGMVDVMRGIRTGQVSSGVGIENLQMMAQALIRLRARALEAMQERVGRKLISRIFQFYEPKRIFEVLNESMGYSQGTMETISSELLKPVSKRNKEAWTDLVFRIEPWSSLGLAKAQRRIESMKLREMQVIDDKALLDDLEYPHRNKVLKRMVEERQAAGAMPPEVAQSPGKGATQFPVQQNASPAGRMM